MGDSLSTSGCNDYIEEIKALIQSNKQKRRDMDNVMDSNRKQNNVENLEPKKESRLTSIIDQLLINKTKDIHQIDDKNSLESSISSSEQQSKSPNNFGTDEVQSGYDTLKYSNQESLDTRINVINNASYGSEYERKSVDFPADNCYTDSRHSDIAAPDRRKQASCSSTSPERSTPRPNDRNLCDLPSSQLEPPGEAQGLRNGFWPKGGDSPVTAPPFDSSRGQQPVPGGVVALATSQKSAFSTFSAASDMPTDTLVAAVGGEPATAPVKDERISPDPDSSPSVSPHSPSPGRGFPGSVGIGFGLRSPAAFSATSPSLDRFATTALGCGSPAIKQMEMMTRNYSDFMRSLAAKYNTQNSQDSFPFCQTNGLIRTMEGPFPFKTTTPPLLGRSMDLDCNTRKTDNHSSPPVLGDHRIPSYTVSEFSSSQTLLNLVRTASAQSASQLENYLRGATKRSHEGENRADPLDLTVTTTKRPRTESSLSLHGSKLPSPSISQDISLAPVVKLEGELRNSPESSPNTKNNKGSWPGFINSHGCKSDRNSPKTASKGRCLSLCTEQSCSTKSEANDVAQWAVDDVVRFVTSIDSCVEYAEKFREQSIDGASLPLLTEDHLTNYMGMKLGPALKLRSTLARLIGHCVVCMHCVHCHGDEQDRRSDASRSPSVSK